MKVLVSRKKGRGTALFWVAALVLALVPACGSGAGAGAGRPRAEARDSLVVLHTNDTHAHLLPFERTNSGGRAGGAAARAELVRKERARARHTVLLDGGDVFQGTPFFSLFHGVPDYRAMTMMGYAAGALGNHDLDDGPLAWIRAAREARFDIRSANVFVDADSGWARSRDEVPAPVRKGARWVGGKKVPDTARLVFLTEHPWEVERVGPIEGVATFGLTTPDLDRLVLRSRNGGVAVGDPIAAARYLVPRLRERASMVICLSHLGEDMDRKLAARVPGIDVIVGGHSHTPLRQPVLVRNATPNGYGGTVIVQAGHRGEYLGRLVLHLEGDRLTRYTGSLLRVRPEDGEDARVASMLRPYAEKVEAETGGIVFRSPMRIPSTGLRDGETPLGNFVADVLREAGGADIGLINSGGIRAAMPAGDVTVGDVHTVLPFDNRVVVVKMHGWQVRQLMVRVARRLGKGGFLQVSGLSFVIRRDRASTIRVGGKALESERVYRVATVDYLAEGGDGYTQFEKALGIEPTDVLLRDAAVSFLKEHPKYTFRKESRIRWEGSSPMFRGGKVSGGTR